MKTKTYSTLFTTISIFLLTILLTNCTKEETPELKTPVEKVSILVDNNIPENTVLLSEGNTIKLDFQVFPPDADYQKIEWISTDNDILEVSHDGVATMKSFGKADVYLNVYYRNNYYRTVKVISENTIHVESPFEQLTDFDIACKEYPGEETLSIKKGETIHLEIKTTPEDAKINKVEILPMTDNKNFEIHSGLSLKGISDGGKSQFEIRVYYTDQDFNQGFLRKYFDISCGEYIDFQDKQVESTCITFWDTDRNNYLSMKEAQAVKTIPGDQDHFMFDNDIKTFDELKYFTGLETIEDLAFWNCHNLESIMLPKNLQKIGVQSFAGCEKLKSLILPDSVEYIDDCAFYGIDCFGKDLKLPQNLKYLGWNVFAFNNTLESLEFDKNIEEIHTSPIFECKNFNSVKFIRKTPPIGGSFWTYDNVNISVFVPKESIENYNKRFFYSETNTYKNYVNENTDIYETDVKPWWDKDSNRMTLVIDWVKTADYDTENCHYTEKVKNEFAADPWYPDKGTCPKKLVYLKKGIYTSTGYDARNIIIGY